MKSINRDIRIFLLLKVTRPQLKPTNKLLRFIILGWKCVTTIIEVVILKVIIFKKEREAAFTS